MSVELHIVPEGNKERVRIAAYIDIDGRRYNGVYNNAWNCRFPRSLRQPGKIYQVPADNVKFQESKNGVRFYSVGTKGITTIQNNNQSSTSSRQQGITITYNEAPKQKPEAVYETSPECVICMAEDSDVIFVPCGHLCSCKTCGGRISKCCICRVSINQRISK